MEILNFGPQGSSPKKGRNRVLLVIGAFALAAIGSTFAASITLNGGSQIQYGQGLQQAAACDQTITLQPQNTFANSAGSGQFNITSVNIYDTATSSSSTGLANCDGKTLKLSAWDTSTSTALFSCPISFISASWSSGFSGETVSCTGSNVSSPAMTAYSTTGVTLTFGTSTQSSGSIQKFTLESY